MTLTSIPVDQLRGNVTSESIRSFVDVCLSSDQSATESDLNSLGSLLPFTDCAYYVLRHLQTRLALSKDDSSMLEHPAYHENVLVLLTMICRTKLQAGNFLGQSIQPKSKLANHTKLSHLRHMTTQLWITFFASHLSDCVTLKAIRLLGDFDFAACFADARQLADCVLPIFDPPSASSSDASEEDSDTGSALPPAYSRLATRAVMGLIGKGGLNYARFYPRLYELLDDSLVVLSPANSYDENDRQTSMADTERFLTDLDTCLSSIHLAAHIVASFVKRLGQLCLLGGCSALIPSLLLLIDNCFKRHPKSRVLIHRVGARRQSSSTNDVDHAADIDKSRLQQCCDPYRWVGDGGPPLDQCHASLESSLWEVASLQTGHCLNDIAKLARLVCHPDPVGNCRQAPPILDGSPGEVTRGQLKQTQACVDRVERCLASLASSNAIMPDLPTLSGWTF